MQVEAQYIPTSDVNLFSDASLREPFQDYHLLRELGPVVKLKTPDVYAISRYADVRDALQAATTLVSGRGVGFGEAWNSQAGMSVIQADGDLHHRLRSAILPPLLPDQISKLRGQLKGMISTRIAALRNAGPFDAMLEISRFLPVEAIAHFVGLSSEGRERLLVWAAAMFNTIGPNPDPNDLAVLLEIRDYIMGLKQSDVKANSWASQLFDHMNAGTLAEHEVMSAIYAYIMASSLFGVG
jgi:cytochrome P450